MILSSGRSSTLDLLLLVVWDNGLDLLNDGRLVWIAGVATIFLPVDVSSTSSAGMEVWVSFD